MLFGVLLQISTLMAPFTPFLTESLYQVLREGLPPSLQRDSVHFLRIPQPRPAQIDRPLEARCQVMLGILEAARFLREKSKINMKHPVMALRLVSPREGFEAEMGPFLDIVREEINVESIVF